MPNQRHRVAGDAWPEGHEHGDEAVSKLPSATERKASFLISCSYPLRVISIVVPSFRLRSALVCRREAVGAPTGSE